MFLKIRAHPGARKEKIIKESEDTFTVYIKEKAERGEANKRMLCILSEYLGIPSSKLRIRKGAHKQNKIIEIMG